MRSALPNLPDSQSEFWEGEKYISGPVPVRLNICSSHTKDEWINHTGYVDNRDGTISCKFCSWGTPLPGYYRLLDGRVIDLRTLNRE